MSRLLLMHYILFCLLVPGVLLCQRVVFSEAESFFESLFVLFAVEHVTLTETGFFYTF